jgi:hypothetical protein
MKTRKIRKVKSKKSRTYLKIHKGGESSDSNKSSVGVQQKSESASSPKGVSSKAAASSPKGASGRASASSPKGASGKAASPPKAASASSSRGKVKVSPRGPSRAVLRMWKRTLSDKYHSDGESGPIVIDRDIANRTKKGSNYFLEEYLKKRQNEDKKKIKRFRRKLQENIPQAPPIIVSPQGRSLVTTYTPTFDIVQYSSRISVRGNPAATAPTLHMTLFHYPYDRPLPLSFLPKNSIKLTPEENSIKMNINMFPLTYDYLADVIYDMLLRINKLSSYANILVKGRLRDELMLNIRITSIEVMQSRLFMSREDTERFMQLVYIYTNQYNVIGPDPFNQMATDIHDVDIESPLADAPDPNSYMVKGYRTHPMFRTQRMTGDEENALVSLSEKHPKLKGEDTALVYAHGAVVNELTPKMKFLANKYLRIIEFGKMGQALAMKYRSFMVKLNYIMQSSFYNVMFDNTDEGETTRDMAFKILCPYIMHDNISSCDTSETLNLVDITHDRFLEGDVEDMMIPENKKISYKSLKNKTTMGIFLPVNHKLDTSTPYLAKKELFKLYPGTTFFSKNTKMNLIESLLPIAIQRNRRINLFIVSCMVDYIEGDDLHNSLLGKPGNFNPAITVLNTGKKFLSKFLRMANEYYMVFYDEYIYAFTYTKRNGRYIFAGYTDYVKDNKHNLIFDMGEKIINFYNTKFRDFKKHSYNSIHMVTTTFSFAGINDVSMSNILIENRPMIVNEWYYPFLDELIKVKIFLMTDFKNLCSSKIGMILTSLKIINKNVEELRLLYGPGPFSDPEFTRTCGMLDNAIAYSKEMLNYFSMLDTLNIYITAGLLHEANTDPDAFANHPKYVEMKKEYDDTSMKKIYEEITANLDYDRYEGENVEFNKRIYKTELMNPLPPDRFRKTARYMYKTKVLPNYDEARRRRKTMKQKLYDEEGIGKRAQQAKSSSAISV